MSWEHSTYGWEKFETFISVLRSLGIPYDEVQKKESYIRGWDGNCICFCAYADEPTSCPCCEGTCAHVQHLRVARFMSLNGRVQVIEEYLAVDDRDCDGQSLVDIAVYEEGRRPRLTALVLDPA